MRSGYLDPEQNTRYSDDSDEPISLYRMRSPKKDGTTCSDLIRVRGIKSLILGIVNDVFHYYHNGNKGQVGMPCLVCNLYRQEFFPIWN